MKRLLRCIGRALDRVEAVLYQRRYEARVRRQMRAGLAPLFVVLVLAAGCAPWQARRSVARIDAACERDYASATTRDEVIAVHDRCEAAYEEVRRGR